MESPPHMFLQCLIMLTVKMCSLFLACIYQISSNCLCLQDCEYFKKLLQTYFILIISQCSFQTPKHTQNSLISPYFISLRLTGLLCCLMEIVYENMRNVGVSKPSLYRFSPSLLLTKPCRYGDTSQMDNK